MARRDRGALPDPSLAAHEAFMRLALREARRGLHLGEVPVGAVVVSNGEVIGSGFNQPIHAVDPTAHAEVVALRQACRNAGNYRLTGATLYATLEPCLLCVGAALNARVASVVFGAAEPKWGAIRSLLDLGKLAVNHRFEVVSGVLEEECRGLVQDFFRFRREEE